MTAGVLQSGRSLLVAEITPEWIRDATPDPVYRDFITRLQPQSMIIVPLPARGQALGTMTLVSLNASRRYTDRDMALAEEIGRRAAVAIDNARLFRESEEARTEAVAANRAKDEFLAVLSHELRTPLNSIAGWIHMLDTGAIEGPQAERALAAVDRNVKVLRRLIEDLLDVSRIIAGKLTLEVSPLDIASLLDQVLESFGREADLKGIHLASDLERTIVLEADPIRLRQVFDNLVANALKFTPAGGRVTVSLRREGGSAAITVSDTGSGIPPEALPHVFDRFRQADSTTTRRHGGLGLGLAITRHLVELHGGTVTAANREGATGAVFTVTLPISSC